MMSWSYIANVIPAVIFLVTYLAIRAYLKALRPNGLPPGPRSIPFIGNLSLIWKNKKIHHTFAELSRQYGTIFSLQLGWYPTVIISDHNILQAAFLQNADKFSNRPNHFLLVQLLDLERGIINSNGELWKASRRLIMSSLRDFGVGKTSLEPKLQAEAEAILWEVGKHRGEPFQLGLIFSKGSSNLISSLLFSKRYDYDDPEFKTILRCVNTFFEDATQLNTYMLLPYLIPLFFMDRHLYTAINSLRIFKKLMKRKLKEHRQTFEPNQIRDFLDVCLDGERQNPGMDVFSDENVFSMMSDLYFAGTDTSNTTMKWVMLFLLKYPHVQDRCRADIMKEVGKERKISLSDRDKLPYIEATICEVQRLANIVPHAVFHCTNGPVKFHGYTLLDKTLVIPDLYSIHMDPELWADPELFRPERFLDVKGKLVKPPYFLPFSLGKRVCAGEHLAKTEMFVFFTSLLQKYTFTCNDMDTLPGVTDGIFGITHSPPPYDIIAEPL